MACPAAATIGTNTGCAYVGSIGTATGTDNCGTPTITNNAPASFPLGTTTVVWISTDAAGNSVTCTQAVTVVDDDWPTISCPAATTIGTNTGCTYVGSIGTATGTDNCTTPTITNNAPASFTLGNTTVTWRQIVTVVDDELPSIICPTNVTVTANNDGSCTATGIALGTATSSDNCNPPTITNNAPAAFPLGSSSVTWRTTDEAGNSVTCVQTVTVNPFVAYQDDPTNQTVCAGTATNVAFSSTPAIEGVVYNWTNNNTDIGLGVSGTGNISIMATNNTNMVQVATIIVTPGTNCAGSTGAPKTFTITVYAKPVVTANPAITICNNTSTGINLTANTPASFTWTIGLITGDITGANDGSGSTINQLLTNHAVSAPGTVQYIVTPISTTNSCPGDPYTITVTVQPALLASSTAGTIACNGGTTNVYVNATGGTAPYTGTGTFTRSAGTYSFTVTDSIGCTALTTIAIIQPTQLVASAIAGVIPCGATTTTVDVSASGGTAPYTGTGTFTRSTGTYTFTVTDAEGCTASTTVVIATASLTVSIGPDRNLCNGSVALTAAISGANTSGPAVTPFTEISGSTADRRIFSGNIDYLAIGNTFSQSEDRNNCNKNTSSTKVLTIPTGAIMKKAYLFWSGSGSVDNTIKLNGTNVTAQGTKTYERYGGFTYFGARAEVTNLVTSSGSVTVSELSWNNGSPYCYDNSAYGGWSLVVVYEQSSLATSRIHINTEKLQFTYPASIYSTTISNISLPAGCSSNATFTIVAFEGDSYKGEELKIAGQNFGENNFRGQSGPNLDILSWNISTLVTSATSSLTYSIRSYQVNTVFGPAIEGLFDYIKILKYNICPPACTGVAFLWNTGATTPGISVSTAGTYHVKVTDCSGCIARDTVVVSNCPPVDPDKCYKLIVRHSGKALTIEGGSTSNGANAEQRTWCSEDNQIWKFEEVENDFYQIMNINSNKSLKVDGASMSNGADIQQWTYTGPDHQKWRLTRNSSNYFVIKAKHSNKSIEVKNSSVADGADIEQGGNGSNYNQQWTITEVGCQTTFGKAPDMIVSQEEVLESDLTLTIQPNPGTSYFNLTIKSGDISMPANVRILDVNGTMVSAYPKTVVNNMLRVGSEKWAAGIYFAEVIQGSQRKVLKLIKVN